MYKEISLLGFIMALQLFVLTFVLCVIVVAAVDNDVQAMEAEIAELKLKTDSLQRNYTLLESILEKRFQEQIRQEKARLQEQFITLQQDVLFVHQEFSSLKNISYSPDNRIPVIEKRLQEEDNKLNTIKNDTDNLKNRLSAHEQDYYALKNTLHGMRPDVHGTIAFKATIENQPAVNPGDTVKFNHITMNSENGYNAATGQFTCPRSGLFRFVVFIKNYENAQLHLRLNGEKINTLFDSYSNTTSVSSVLELNVGDKVWVSHNIDNYRIMYLRNNYKMTGSFLGYLISAN